MSAVTIAASPSFLGARVARRFSRRPTAVAGSALCAFAVLVAVFAQIIAPYPPDATDFSSVLAPPFSAGHLLGTDELGRDTLTRVIWGARVSMQAGVLATLLAMLIGVPLGLAGGYFGGWLDAMLMRATDTMLAFPFLVLAMGLSVIFGPSLAIATFAVGLVQMPKQIRVTRGEVLSLREETYVAAAVADGAPDWHILLLHILPNAANTLVVQATVLIPYAILAESTLSFLGLGVQPPTPSWGGMLTAAQPYMTDAPWLAVAPGLAILATALSFNLLGDGLRDALDPKGPR